MINNFPQVLAHRGASHYAPENTVAAFELAAQMGAKWVEVDLHLTADDNVVIIHNPTINKCTNGRGNVCDFTTEQLLQFDAGSWFDAKFSGQKLVMLDQLIQLLTRLNLQVNLELKVAQHDEVKLAQATARIVRKHWPANKSLPLFSSFWPSALAAIKEAMPDAPRALLLEKWDPAALNIADQLQCIGINLDRKIVTPEIVRTIKNTNRKILVYTVNSWRVAKPLFQMGVDGVFTNRPDIMLEKLATFS